MTPASLTSGGFSEQFITEHKLSLLANEIHDLANLLEATAERAGPDEDAGGQATVTLLYLVADRMNQMVRESGVAV